HFLSSLILRSPKDYIWLMREVGLSRSRIRPEMEQDLSLEIGRAASGDIPGILRQNRYREMLRIGVRDLLGSATLEETVADISRLAEVSIEAAVQEAFREMKEKHGIPVQTADGDTKRPGKFCVLGLGKLGGEELNYSSDIDLFYLYSSHAGMTTGRPAPGGGYRDAIENHRFFVRMGEIVTRLLGDRTGDGIVFRVDLRLRPEGESGEIAYSLASLEAYYESWGRTFDRLALLKGRPVAGDHNLGENFLELMSPFIYRRHMDYQTLEEIAALKDRINLQLGKKPRGARDIKLGRGGIREIEFMVQSLQLIHGGRNPAIREKNTLRALDRLMRNGFLSERDAADLREAYIFLRNVEHRIQLVEERQTQTLPSGKEDLERIAWTLGYNRGRMPQRDRFERDLGRFRDRVQALYDRLFAQVDAKAGPAEGESGDLLDENLSREEAETRLSGLGFVEPTKAREALLLLRDGTRKGGPAGASGNLLRRILPGLLENLRTVPDPDGALVHFERFLSRVGARTVYYSMLAENPEALKLLAVLFGSSPFLSSLVIRQPDLLDIIVSGSGLSSIKPEDVMAEEVRGLVVSSPSLEDELNVLRRYRNGEILRIGLGDLLGLREIEEINLELTSMAEVLVRAVWNIARREAAAKGGDAGPFAVVAMGKMGGREMNFGSDLDLIFLYEGPEASREFQTRVAQRLISFLSSPSGEGVLYRIDMRLRPSGHYGPLVTTLEAFERYHREDAMVWERQAMTKARWIAGDADFREKVTAILEKLPYDRPFGAGDLEEVIRVRARMEEEIAEEGKKPFLDIKAGRGGLVDIEFAVQALQLVHGRQHPGLRTPSTLKALEFLAETGLVEEKKYNTARRAYLFDRRSENRSQIYQGRSESRIPTEPKEAIPFARRSGFPGGEDGARRFLEEIVSTRDRIREVFDHLMGALKREIQSGS
ncbi:MAG: bifunctional [glutamate--ammonia ligase]-adenylyl-L-tyrosine phosphorylase/[glutamate--ammonia-ligase] adenylyltransferase, partial [Proteobacteria bacterium]|nr:bifunctional [glutamate--ammonia ligase]-adenylyl-L-tyrosine phosphorylase/[glutamate--ammonia-ligase] adenylyltransferase [Pseudomonadota bacterium]